MGAVTEKEVSSSFVHLDSWRSMFESFEYPDFFLNTSFALRGQQSIFRCSCYSAGHLTVTHGKEQVEFASIHSDEVQNACFLWKKMSTSTIDVLLQQISALPKDIACEINLYLQPAKFIILNCTFSNERLWLLHEAFSHPDNLKMIKRYKVATSLITTIFHKFRETGQRRITDGLFSWELIEDKSDSYLSLRVNMNVVNMNASKGVDIYEYGELFFSKKSRFDFRFDFQLCSHALSSLNRILERV
jgi:hypothetical protein